MQDFHNDRQFGNHRPRKSFGGDRGNNSGDREMFDAVCVTCGKNCRVPFRPTSGKPIYCSDCFESVEKDRDNRDGGNFSRPARRNSFDRPQSDRPRYDRPSFSPRRETPATPTVNLDALTQKIEDMNNKLDLLLHTLTHKSEE